MTHPWKRIVSVLLAGAMLFALSACSFSNSCNSCGDRPTKGYRNEYDGEKEYYCSDCSSECDFCGERATKHYTSMLGVIIFACKDCYKEMATE